MGIEGEGEGDDENQAEPDLEKAMRNELRGSKQASGSNLDADSRGDFEKAADEGSVMLGDIDNISDSDDENESVYDIEGRDDQIADLRTVDIRDYKYAIDKKLLFSMDEDEEIKKIRYLFKELLLDLGIGRFTFIPTLISSIIMLIALWMRMYIHYLFQYIFLKAIDVPITQVDIKVHTVELTYGFWNVYQEVISVSAGVVGTTISFVFLIFLTWIGHKCVDYFPKTFSKFVVWFGFGTLGDGVLCAIVDTATRHSDGDFYKLANYYDNAENSPIAGYIVICMIYLFFIVFNLLIFYNYMVFLHLNGRMQDIYIRLLGDPKVFFCPHDNEMSLRHLLWCYYTAIVNSHRIVVNHLTLDNDYGEKKALTTMQTSSYETTTSLEIMRSFIRDEIGCIKELTEKEISYLNAKEFLPLTKMLSKVPTNKSREFDNKVGGLSLKNLALKNIELANPYRNKMMFDDQRSQVEGSMISHRSSYMKSSFKRKDSLTRKLKTNRNGLPRAGTMLSRKSSHSKYSRPSSLRFRKSTKSIGSKKSKMSKQSRFVSKAPVFKNEQDKVNLLRGVTSIYNQSQRGAD